jgi:hypothetical protein
MSADPRVIAAISSAVGLYLQAEQEEVLHAQQLSEPAPAQQLSEPAPAPAPAPVVMSSPFALAGRQAAMNIRWTWQMRLPR